MNHSGKLTLAGIIALAATAAAGCGYAPAASADHTVRAGSMAANPCFLTDLTKIRSSASKTKVAPETMAAIPRHLIMSTDDRSFVTLVRAADLTLAGINTSTLPQDQQVLLIVNHGTWDWSTLRLSRGGNAAPGGVGDGQPAVANWILYVLDPKTYRVIIRVVSPDNPCFIG